jgi:hypothetical protein
MKKQEHKSVKEFRQRDRVIFIRATSAEYSKIVARASKFPSVNAYMLQMGLKGKIVERPATISLNQYLELNRIGNNINQIAKRINSSEANIFHKGTKKELEQMIDELKAVLAENTSNLKKIIR